MYNTCLKVYKKQNTRLTFLVHLKKVISVYQAVVIRVHCLLLFFSFCRRQETLAFNLLSFLLSVT